MSVILKASHICVAYEGKKVVENVSFEVERGDYLCIVGENGTGKSSLVKAMLGLVPTCCGKAEFNLKNGRKRIGYLPQQNVMQNNFPASVKETVLSGCLSGMKFPKIYGKKERDTAEEYMKYLDIYELGKKSVGLDINAAKDLYNCLEKINKEKNITIIMISHDMQSALRYATKILHLDKTLLFYGSKEDYLLSPYSKRLLS